MRSVLLRTAGFSVPTVAIVLALHLVKEPTAAEAVDGVVSALWFVAFYFLGAWSALRLGIAGSIGVGNRAVSHLLLGASAAVLVWCFLWAFWALPVSASLRLHPRWVFAVHTLMMAVVGMVLGQRSLTRAPRGLSA